MRIFVLVLVAVCFVWAGCGESDEDKASEVAVAFMEALGEEEVPEACDLLSAEAYDDFGGEESCAETMVDLNDSFDVELPEATQVSLDGDVGEVEVEVSGGATFVVDVARDGDDWGVENVSETG